MRPRSLLVRYAAGLAFAYLLCAAEVLAIVISVSGEAVIGAQAVLDLSNLIATVAIVVFGTASVAIGGAAVVTRAFHNPDRDRNPNAPRKSPNITRRQSAVLLTTWIVAAAMMIPLNVSSGGRVEILIISAVMFGATATVCTGFLFTQRSLRALMVAATVDLEDAEKAPGVRARLILMWTMCTALPGAGIVVLVMLRANGWVVQPGAPIEVPVLVLALVAVVLGLRAIILVSASISDPVDEVVDSMAEVERGHLGKVIDVYERSELGQLQSGFNRMVAGLRERDRLRDLFGRHVGEEVVRRAVDEHESVSVDEKQGLINKFQGDAALAIFGAPLHIEDPASTALATARDLRDELRRLPV